MYSLIITEKPSVSRRVASALADDEVKSHKDYGAEYLSFTNEGNDFYVVSAVGHLYGLKQKEGKWEYPVFDIGWVPIWETNKSSGFAKNYLQTIKKLAKGANMFYLATDYDIEGELIGHNILKHACPVGSLERSKRLRFSALTQKELLKAFKDSGALDVPLAEAGECRHILDWYWGINVSRALIHALRNATNQFLTVSTGRVQGPALKILVEREREIAKFVPEPFWRLSLPYKVGDKTFTAWHEKGDFKVKEEAEAIKQKCSGRPAIVKDYVAKRVEQAPPVPFDLTTLQTEAYRVFRFNPKYTQRLAQTLYEQGLITYPRTASQKLPPTIDYSAILSSLEQNPLYAEFCRELLEGELKPNEGKGSDPAHPAIYPTGERARGIDKPEQKLYDLIAKRFLAVFAKPAVRETVTVGVDSVGEIFISKGSRTVEQNWHRFYQPYVNLKEEELPSLEKGQELDVDDVQMHDKMTQPPPRYTQASLVRQLEKLGLGTKATRAEVVSTLIDRDYVHNQSLEVSDFGMGVTSALEKHCSDIIDIKLTGEFEKELERIRERKVAKGEVIEHALKKLTKVLGRFKQEEEAIGEELKGAYIGMRRAKRRIGQCPNCDGMLKIIVSKRTKKRFIGCSNYPKCSTGFPLPQSGTIKVLPNLCEHCDLPMVQISGKGRPWRMCISPQCPSKAEWGKKKTKVTSGAGGGAATGRDSKDSGAQ